MNSKHRLRFIFLFSFFLLTSCGGSSGGSSEEESNEVISVLENYNEPLDYIYNEDGSATQELLPFYVNKYEEVQNKLDSLTYDQEAFDNYYEWYIGDLISTQRSIDEHPSYAPRGDGKSLSVAVNNGMIDYSDYPLIGDLDDNGTVDFDDEGLLKNAIYQPNNVDVKYDLNGDGSIDISDMINLMARIGTEIKTFDFYTSSGEKLNIPSRDFSDSRSFSYTGSEGVVMIVAKDINKVSGFTEGLSDIRDLWYIANSRSNISSSALGDSNTLVSVDNTTNKKLEKSATTGSKITAFHAEGLEATSPERLTFVRDALDYIQQTPDPYLLGWKISVKFRTTDSDYLELDSNGMLDMDDDVYFGGLVSDIEPHFEKTTMGKDTKQLLEKNSYLYHIGAGRYDKDEIIDGKYNFDLMSDSFITHVKAYRKSFKTSRTVNGKTIFINNIAHASSVIFTSEDDKTLSGFIKEEGELTKDEGTIKATRIGPDPEETSKEGDLNRAEYTLADIPFGAYKLEYRSGCGCEQIIDNEFIFSENREYVDEDFNINKKDATVHLTILDKNQNPLTGKNVKIVSDACLADEQTFLGSSDNSGKVSFNEVPVGKYSVSIDDKESSSITFCDNYNSDVLAEPLWDISVSFRGRLYNQDWSWEDVRIASSTDELKTEYDPEFPFPYEHQYGGKILVDTAFYDDTEDGLVLTYYENALVNGNGITAINKGYSFDLEYLIDTTGDTGFNQGDPAMTPTWDLIQTSLNGVQEAAYLNHEAFTLHDTGEWINDQGTSSLTITFTPAD